MQLATVLLFDLDGTLIRSNDAGIRAFNRAFAVHYGVPEAIARVDWRGKPDTRIIAEMLAVHGLPADQAAIERVRTSYLQFLEETVMQYPGRLPPGIPSVLVAARERGFWLGLGTGNFQRGARIKLAVHDLNRFFPVGAFAEDAFDRAELIRRAAERARSYYRQHSQSLASRPDSVPAPGAARPLYAHGPAGAPRLPAAPAPDGELDRVVVVGDTPLDIEAAARNGYYSLAVATGTHSWGELSACHPTLLYPDLGAVQEILDAVEQLPPSPAQQIANSGAPERSSGSC